MTITRLFFYATFATCTLHASVTCAHAVAEEVPAVATTTGKPAATATRATGPGVAHAPPAKHPARVASTPQASTHDGYHLFHSSHPLDSYRNAVTPAVTADR